MGMVTIYTAILAKRRAAKLATDSPTEWQRKSQRDEPPPPSPPPPPPRPKSPFDKVKAFLSDTSVAFTFFLVFLALFQNLLILTRSSTDYWLTHQVNEVFLNNEFDSHHHDFHNIRRIHDIWEWLAFVMVPGVLSNTPAPYESWPDARMSFSVCHTTDGLGQPLADASCPEGVRESTRYSIKELRDQFNYFDYSDGILFRQIRAKPRPDDVCPGEEPCLRNTHFPDRGDTEPYGHGNNRSFVYWDQADLGTPKSQLSPSLVSMNLYDGGGFVAVMIPFFTDRYLDPLVDARHGEIGYQLSDVRVTPTNRKKAVYYCIRTSINGIDISQTCDGNPDTATNTNAVYDHAVAFLDRLKEGHWLDFQTRFFQIEMQISNPNGGMAILPKFIFELPAQGGVLPSTSIMSMPIEEERVERMLFMADLVLALVLWFVLVECVTLYKEGFFSYIQNGWNWLDWFNFVLFLVTYSNLAWAYKSKSCVSQLCEEVGLDPIWYRFLYFLRTKQTIGVNATLQLLKIIRFTNVLFPKMSLLSRVLQKGAVDLALFAVLFCLSLVAFSNMFYVILGANMPGYYSGSTAVVTLSRALFGDFDVDEINDNSPDHLNAVLFLLYLFVAVFILLSMFLAILADAQANVVMPPQAPPTRLSQLLSLIKRSAISMLPAKAQDDLAAESKVPGGGGTSPSRTGSPLEERVIQLEKTVNQMDFRCSQMDLKMTRLLELMEGNGIAGGMRTQQSTAPALARNFKSGLNKKKLTLDEGCAADETRSKRKSVDGGKSKPIRKGNSSKTQKIQVRPATGQLST